MLTALDSGRRGDRFSGTAEERSCGLEVWIPGTNEPDFDNVGITNLEATEVPGGWLVTGCADGDYTAATKR